MKFSTRTTYGLRAIIRLAEAFGGNSVSLASISREEDISLKYLERIFSSLKKAEIIKSEKGVTGGYSLIQDPSEVTILRVVKALEGDMNLFHCMGDGEKIICSSKCGCTATRVLKTVQDAINKSLNSMTLKDLL